MFLITSLPLLLLLPLSEQPATTVALTVQVTNVQSTQGYVQAALYNTPNAFPGLNNRYRVVRVPATGSVVTCEFNDLPPGTYALAIFHDKNSDGVCNLNLLGVPTEPYGFSNNLHPWWRAPTFKEAQVEMQQALMIQIALIH